jgi:DNA-binding beta-propeller fold protein YncE
MVDQNGPTLSQPFVLEAPPVDAVMDPLTGRLYVGLKGNGAQSSIAVLNASTGERVATVSITNGQVTNLVVNPSGGLLYALIPSIEQLTVIDLRTNALQQSVRHGPLAQVTGMVLSTNSDQLYMSDLAGNLLIFDARDPRAMQQMRVSGSGLAGIAASGDRVFVINTPGKRVIVVDPGARSVVREVALQQEPGAIAAGAEDGMVYVLGTQQPAIIRVDPEQGTTAGMAFLPARSGLMNIQPGGARDLSGLRSRLAINPFDGSIYVTQPEIGTVSVVSADKFPPIEDRQ